VCCCFYKLDVINDDDDDDDDSFNKLSIIIIEITYSKAGKKYLL